MIPPLIVEYALNAGLDVIAVTDHNASANAAAVMDAAMSRGLRVLPGMELQTREEVHLLCLFDSLEQVTRWQAEVDAALPALPNRAETLGEQYVVDAAGDFVRREERLLLISANFSLEHAARRVHELGGMAIPAHIDRPANGLMALLGLVPPGFIFPAFEISSNITAEAARTQFQLPSNAVLVQSSDAHWLEAIGAGATEFDLDGPRGVGSLRRALRDKRVRIH